MNGKPPIGMLGTGAIAITACELAIFDIPVPAMALCSEGNTFVSGALGHGMKCGHHHACHTRAEQMERTSPFLQQGNSHTLGLHLHQLSKCSSSMHALPCGGHQATVNALNDVLMLTGDGATTVRCAHPCD